MIIRNIQKIDDKAYIFEIQDSQLGWIHSSASSEYESEVELYQEIADGKHGAVGLYRATKKSRADVETSRKAAYSDAFTGSDRLFAEAQRMQLMSEAGWEVVRDQAIVRFEEIKAQHPWPAE